MHLVSPIFFSTYDLSHKLRCEPFEFKYVLVWPRPWSHLSSTAKQERGLI